MKRWFLFLFIFTLGCVWGEDKEASFCEQCGVYSDKVVLGSSLALAGHAGYLGTQFLRGALSYLKEVNARGGVFGRKIKLIYYDDGYDPPRCLYNTQRLIIQDKVFALFCYVGTPTTLKVLPFIEEARIPLIGMFTGAHALRHPFNPYLINIRPSYYEETKQAIEHLVEDLGIKRIGIFYQYDAYGFDGLTGTELALKKYGLAPVVRASYIRGTSDILSGFKKIWNSKPDAVVLVGTYNSCAKFIQLATKKEFFPIFYAVSFVGANELARRVADFGQKIIMSQVVPPPSLFSKKDKQGYPYLLAKYFPKDEISFVGLEGFVNAKILIEGLKRAGKNLTRTRLLKALESINHLNLGHGMVVSFRQNDHQGLDKVYFTILKGGKFELIKDWEEVKCRSEGSSF
ncbi:ABC transporter substrate-binding protein [Desulfonauticus submarinus]|uniref:ABC transporter substrate-binding protein n=1 Tax=Desulfonauticus submarinus TaxID=206665 RepID=UPI000B835272|nr:ABC transporter substrate-binding protein [Desulfonauticus submarinus]